jgi:hypothetical protein
LVCIQKFCEECHNAENINFYIEVAKYRKLFLGQAHLWPHSDKPFASTKYNAIGDWPSSALPKEAVDIRIQQIYDRFLSVSAPEQICIGGGAKYRTLKKMALPSLYGPVVFDEALYEPVKSMESYIIPLFLRSQLFSELQEYEDLLDKLPVANLELDHSQLPPIIFQTRLDAVTTVPSLVWTDIYRNYELYTDFSDFMHKQACGENLSCYHLIETYQKCFDSATEDASLEIKRLYKLIFAFFIAKDSPHEIYCREAARTGMLLSVAAPRRHTFDEAKGAVTKLIMSKFSEFLAIRYPASKYDSHIFQVSANFVKVVKQKKKKDRQEKKERPRRDTGYPGSAAAEAAAEAVALSITHENKHTSLFSSWFKKSTTKQTIIEMNRHQIPGKPRRESKLPNAVAALRGAAAKISP